MLTSQESEPVGSVVEISPETTTIADLVNVSPEAIPASEDLVRLIAHLLASSAIREAMQTHLLTTEETAHLLGVRPGSVRRLVEQGHLGPALEKKPGDIVVVRLFDRSQVERLAQIRAKYPPTRLGPHPWQPPDELRPKTRRTG